MHLDIYIFQIHPHWPGWLEVISINSISLGGDAHHVRGFTWVPTTAICGSCIMSAPTVLNTSCSLFMTGIRASMFTEETQRLGTIKQMKPLLQCCDGAKVIQCLTVTTITTTHPPGERYLGNWDMEFPPTAPPVRVQQGWRKRTTTTVGSTIYDCRDVLRREYLSRRELRMRLCMRTTLRAPDRQLSVRFLPSNFTEW